MWFFRTSYKRGHWRCIFTNLGQCHVQHSHWDGHDDCRSRIHATVSTVSRIPLEYPPASTIRNGMTWILTRGLAWNRLAKARPRPSQRRPSRVISMIIKRLTGWDAQIQSIELCDALGTLPSEWVFDLPRSSGATPSGCARAHWLEFKRDTTVPRPTTRS